MESQGEYIRFTEYKDKDFIQKTKHTVQGIYKMVKNSNYQS